LAFEFAKLYFIDALFPDLRWLPGLNKNPSEVDFSWWPGVNLTIAEDAFLKPHTFLLNSAEEFSD
jgi:hypothetical protein